MHLDTGTEMVRIAAACKATGNKDLRLEMIRSVRKVGKPLIKNVRTSARTKLPKGGGLNVYVARSSIRTIVKASSASASVAVRGSKKNTGARLVDLDAIDRGRLRHPTYGGKPWKLQKVPEGFFSEPMEDAEDEARDQLEQVLDLIARKLA